MPSNKLGIYNNNVFIPYTATTKQSKWIDITITDGTRAVVASIKLAKAVFYADSTGKWFMDACFSLTANLTTGSNCSLTFSNITFLDTTDAYGACYCYVSSTAHQTAGDQLTYVIPNTSTLTINFAASVTGANGLFILGNLSRIPLKQEPTTYTISANMEGVLAANVFIPQVASGVTGLFPANNTSLDDVTATRLGLKQYLHGTNYNGGNSPTISAGTNITSIGNIRRGVFIPYQCQDGAWRLKLNIVIDGSTASNAAVHEMAINGVTFKNATNLFQGLSGGMDTAWAYIAVKPFTDDIQIGHTSPVTPTAYYISGDVELDTKPTWAY